MGIDALQKESYTVLAPHKVIFLNLARRCYLLYGSKYLKRDFNDKRNKNKEARKMKTGKNFILNNSEDCGF